MLGISRDSMEKLHSIADSKSADSSNEAATADLLKVAVALSSEKPLLVALVDSGKAVSARETLAREIFANAISPLSMDLVIQGINLRWVEEIDFVEALESVASRIAFISNISDIDQIEQEIFGFSKAISKNPDLQMALTNPAISAEIKRGIVTELLKSQTTSTSLQLLEHTAANLRGRRVDTALRALSDAAAAARNRVVADVKVAHPLAADQADRLAKVLGRLAGKDVSLNVVIDPSIIGGVSVRLGDEVIDGTVQTRLDQARRALVG